MDYDKYCQIPFGEYVKNKPKKTNTQTPITIDDIYLTVKFKNQGGCVILDLKYGLTITRRNVTDIPVKNLAVKAVDNMAARNKITDLKFENKSGVLLNINYWLTGVDYEDKNSNEIKDTHDDENKSHKYYIKQYEIVNAEEHFK